MHGVNVTRTVIADDSTERDCVGMKPITAR